MQRYKLTHDRLLELLRYDPDTGHFYCRVARKTLRVGQRAGGLDAKGYHKLRLDGAKYYGHRLAWFYVHQEWPVGYLDHRNMVTDDNRIANLRQATNSQNQANRVAEKINTHGFKGVRRKRGRWVARLNHGKTYYHLGSYATPEEAQAAYMAKAVELFGEFARAA